MGGFCVEIRIKNESEDFYFCEIVNENGDVFNCEFRKLCNLLKKDIYNRKSILERCTKLDATNNVVFEMYGDINIYFSPSLYSYISVKKNDNERTIWFGYNSCRNCEFIKSDSISHNKYGYYEAISNIDESDLSRRSELYLDNYFTNTPLVYRYGTGNLPTEIELDLDCPSNEEILEIIGISKLGARIAALFEEQKQSLVLKPKQQDTITKS